MKKLVKIIGILVTSTMFTLQLYSQQPLAPKPILWSVDKMIGTSPDVSNRINAEIEQFLKDNNLDKNTPEGFAAYLKKNAELTEKYMGPIDKMFRFVIKDRYGKEEIIKSTNLPGEWRDDDSEIILYHVPTNKKIIDIKLKDLAIRRQITENILHDNKEYQIKLITNKDLLHENLPAQSMMSLLEIKAL